MNQDVNEQIEETEDPVETVYTYLVNEEHRSKALFLVQSLEQSFEFSKVQFKPEVLMANSKSHFNLDLIPYYQQLLTVKNYIVKNK